MLLRRQLFFFEEMIRPLGSPSKNNEIACLAIFGLLAEFCGITRYLVGGIA